MMRYITRVFLSGKLQKVQIHLQPTGLQYMPWLAVEVQRVEVEGFLLKFHEGSYLG